MFWIFLSYHHQDSHTADLLHRHLEDWLGENTVFMFQRTSDLGFFPDQIEAVLRKCKEVIFLIAEHWHMDDWITKEYKIAKELGGKQIIPVLAHGRTMPLPDDLPADCKEFCGYQACTFEPIPDRNLAREALKGRKDGTPRIWVPSTQRIRELRGKKDGATYIWIGKGEFFMGVSDLDLEAAKEERPKHRVEIDDGFWIGRTPVTVGQYEKFLRETGKDLRNPNVHDLDLPVVNVSWMEAKAYCEWAGEYPPKPGCPPEREGPRTDGCLPKEEEWEYAARAGTRTSRCGYDNLNESAWWLENAGNSASPRKVGLKKPNRWGLHDVLGNVWEWCSDCKVYEMKKKGSAALQKDSAAPQEELHVARGGSYASSLREVRVSHRYFINPDSRLPYVGFRCVIKNNECLEPIPPEA
jgi:formylglycine-generating enzyme required for sulfatase activity